MKPTGRANKPERNLSSAIRGALTDSGLDLETKIFSESGRGRTFFLTSLFIELIDGVLNKSKRFLYGLIRKLHLSNAGNQVAKNQCLCGLEGADFERVF
jgi:hypothetical protein